jgi:hypothetical protein
MSKEVNRLVAALRLKHPAVPKGALKKLASRTIAAERRTAAAQRQPAIDLALDRAEKLLASATPLNRMETLLAAAKLLEDVSQDVVEKQE